MKLFNAITLVCLLAFTACKSKETKPVFGDEKPVDCIDSNMSKAYVTQIGKDWMMHSTSVDYINFSYPFAGHENKVILKTISEKRNALGAEEVSTRLTITPIFFEHKNKDVKNYSAQVDADYIEYKEACLFAKKAGVSEKEDFYSVLNPLNGEELLTFTNEYVDAVIPNSKVRRFFGFTSTKCDYFKTHTREEKNIIGIITYASNQQKLNSFLLCAKQDEVFNVFSLYSPSMYLTSQSDAIKVLDGGRRLGLMSLDEKYKATDISNFTLEITFYYGDNATETKMTIPVKNDAIDIKQIQFDKNIFELKSLE